MSFDEINDLVPGGLPPSAYRHDAWWSNEDASGSTHSQSRLGWMAAGYIATADRARRQVTFTRHIAGRDPAEREVVLRLDRATAEDLYVALHEFGEHIAAGAAITAPTAEETERIGLLLQGLAHSLGRRCSPYCDHLTPSRRTMR